MASEDTANALAYLNQTLKRLIDELHELNNVARELSENLHLAEQSSRKH